MPARRIVLIAGPSGSGKGEMVRRSGLPFVALDEFYRDGDAPDLPSRFGITDWDSPASWDAGAALEALTALAHDGTAQVPTYSISASRRTGMRVVDAGQAPLIVAEGLFASELIAPLAAAGLLADAMVLRRPVPIVFALRLIRDLRESRKPPLTLLRRGAGLARDQREAITRWRNAGMRPTGMRSGVRSLRRDTALAHAEARIRARGHRPDVLAITAVSFLREGPLGTEVLAVRKRGTGSYMQVGGKLEPGEAALQAAIREVEEELGVRLAPEDLELLGEFEAAAANEPDTLVRSTVFVTDRALPDPLVVRAELADHRWFGLRDPGGGTRLAPLMTHHILPALRALA